MNEDATWMIAANCRNEPSSLFFPADDRGTEAARRICADCPVRLACLQYAITHRIQYGVWGGLSEEARRRHGSVLRLRLQRRTPGL